ncbi:MAG: YraN family protein [Clostridiales bacterium]|jgi:putative endonuclease|nr:YraN family protein [Clostridiales bacterium]
MKIFGGGGNITKGKRGEDIAADYLRKKGYRILNRNYTTELGEIDLVITDNSALIFVEVKCRAGDGYGTPAEAVTYHKRGKINRVAAQYIKKFMLSGTDVRFDVVEIYLDEKRTDFMKINHIENAFDSYLRY